MDSPRFMASSLTFNLSEGIHRIKCKFEHDDKECKTCRTKYKNCGFFLEYTKFKADLIEHKFLCCNKNYQYKFVKILKERFFNTYRFSNHDNSKFIITKSCLSLRIHG